jgi:hypothetical protein
MSTTTEEQRLRKKASVDAFKQRVNKHLVELHGEGINTDQSPFSVYLEAYYRALKTKYTIYSDEEYTLLKQSISQDKIHLLTPDIREHIRRKCIDVREVSIFSLQSTSERSVNDININRDSVSKELICDPKKKVRSHTDPTLLSYRIIVPISKIAKILEKIHISTTSKDSTKNFHVKGTKFFKTVKDYFIGIPREIVRAYAERCAHCQQENIVTEKNLRRQRFYNNQLKNYYLKES